MSKCVALLRGINVGGKNKIAMAGLRDMFCDLGLTEVQTLLQSGNVVFRPDRRSNPALEKLLESATQDRFSIDIDYCIRTESEWRKIVSKNPFSKEAGSDPSHLVIMYLKQSTTAKSVKQLQATMSGPERVRGDGRELYFYYPAGIGTSKLTNAVIEKAIGTRGTARNWNTVMKLARLLDVD